MAGITHARNDSLQAARLLTLAEEEKDPKQRLYYAVKSLSIGKQTRNHVIIARAYRQLGYIYRKERSSRLYEMDSLFVYHAGLSGNEELLFDALQLTIKDNLNNNQVRQAEQYLPELDSLSEKSNDAFRKCIASQSKAFLYFKKFNPARSLQYAKNGLQHAESLQNDLLILRSLSQVGNCYVYLMRHDSAAIYLFRALDAAKNIGNDHETGIVYGMLAFLYQASANFSKAVGYYEQARTCYEKTGHIIEAAYIPLQMSDIYFTQKKYDSAYHCIHKALAAFEQCGSREGTGMAYNFLGRYYNLVNKKDSAGHFFALGKQTLKPLDNSVVSFYADSYEAVHEVIAGNYNKADTLLKKVVGQMPALIPEELLDEVLNKLEIPGYSDSMKNATKEVMLSGDAGRLINDYTIVNPFTGAVPELDSLIVLKQNEAVAEAEARHRVKEYRDSTLLAHNESRLVRQQLTQRNLVLSFSFLLLLVILLLLYVQIRSRKRAQADKEQIAFLKKEADHRVDNMLNNILTIIRRVKTGTTDPESFLLLEEKTEPLIALYRMLNENQAGSIEMKPYLETICNGLKDSYDHGNKTDLRVEAPVLMQGASAGRVGLIVNELVTNSFKYAFANCESGTVTVICSMDAGNRYYLSVSDTGSGMQHVQPKPDSMGLLLVRALAQQLGATIKERTEDGVTFEFYFN